MVMKNALFEWKKIKVWDNWQFFENKTEIMQQMQ